MEFFMQLFPGIGTFFAVEPVIAVARIVLIVFGFVLACLGFKRTLEPLIMVPMGIGMMAVNCGMMFLTSGTVGNLLLDLREQKSLPYLLISHDLSMVRHLSDRILVMYLGEVVEESTAQELYTHPLHPYTKALFSAIPVPDPTAKMNRIVLEGSIPSPANPPAGCKFHTRCAQCMEQCKTEVPEQREIEPGHFVVCHLYDQK